MDAPKLQAASDLSAAQWISAQLGGAVGAVTQAVPGGYPAYARICHPAQTRPVRSSPGRRSRR
jgi:hypothetical protein